jgi:virulence-associated protein VapD
MAKGRKQITFDLDTKALKIYYPSESWNNSYEVIKRHMVNNGFSWLQGSVYVSNQPMTTTEVTHILDELVIKNPWLNLCMRDCRETNIGKEHDKSHIFDKNAIIPTRAGSNPN